MRFFIITIFQMVRTYTKQLEAEKLLNTIIIDEAHVIFGKPRDNDTYDGHNIAMKKLDEIVSGFLKELRSRGVGAIFADQQPSSILSAPGTQPALRILFRLENACASLFTNDPEEVQFIMGQENYTAVVINGTVERREEPGEVGVEGIERPGFIPWVTELHHIDGWRRRIDDGPRVAGTWDDLGHDGDTNRGIAADVSVDR